MGYLKSAVHMQLAARARCTSSLLRTCTVGGCVYICGYVCTSALVCISMFVEVCLFMCVYVRTCACVHVCVSICVWGGECEWCNRVTCPSSSEVKVLI